MSASAAAKHHTQSIPVTLGLRAHEQEMLDALVESGVEVVPGKRYTTAEVHAILEATYTQPLTEHAAMRAQDCGALLRDDDGEIPDRMPMQRGAYSHRIRNAERKIKALLHDAVQSCPDLIGACS